MVDKVVTLLSEHCPLSGAAGTVVGLHASATEGIHTNFWELDRHEERWAK